MPKVLHLRSFLVGGALANGDGVVGEPRRWKGVSMHGHERVADEGKGTRELWDCRQLRH